MPFIGKNGSDAIAIAFEHMCRVVLKYNAKCRQAIATAVSDSVITSEQADTLYSFLDSLTLLCDVWRLVAGNSGF